MRAVRCAGRRLVSKLSVPEQQQILANAGRVQDKYWNEMDESLRDAFDRRPLQEREAEARDKTLKARSKFDESGRPNLDHPEFARLMRRYKPQTVHAVHKPGLRHVLGVEGLQERDQHQNATMGGYADQLEAVIDDERNGKFHFDGARLPMYPRPEQMEHMRKAARQLRDQKHKAESLQEDLELPEYKQSEYFAERIEAGSKWDCFDVDEAFEEVPLCPPV
ncbi:MAG: hypothetical protein MHM6MM_008691, partial [Cercozoa sp. M6MM]